MSKPVNKANTSDNKTTEYKVECLAEEMLKISSAVNRLNNVLNGYADGLITKIMSVVKRSVSYRIIQASSNARLSAYDEKFFEYYSGLMSDYKDLISFYEESGRRILEAGDIMGILDGMVSILSSQVNQSVEADGKLPVNPVTAEKNLIVTNNINRFVDKFDGLQRDFISNCLDDFHTVWRETVSEGFEFAGVSRFINHVLEELKILYMDGFYSGYASGFKKCCAELNDINSRTAANFYYEQIVKEREILSSLIIIQISALDKKSKETSLSETDRFIVSEFINKLLEAHQRFGGQVSEIAEYMAGDYKNQPSSEPETFEKFEEYIKSQTESAQIFSSKIFEDAKSKFQAGLDQLAECLGNEVLKKIKTDIKNFETTKKIYELQKEISAQIMMADEIAGVFDVIVRHYKNNEQALANVENMDIIKAIAETVEIKNESIHDNKGIFAEDIKSSLELMKNDDIAISPENMKEYCYKAFAAYISNGQTSLESALDSAITEEKIAALKQTYLKKQSGCASSIEKKILQFKKEHLLYEISTFEEILNFSIIRIRESSDGNVLDFVKTVDGVVRDIQIILKKNGIDMIRPSAHDMFNGKEHEVLIAEKNGEFQKGEIIKLMNSGYRQGNVVILRANVVAAK